MMIALIGLNANAAMYLVGNGPLGGWSPNGGLEMTEQGDGVYTYDLDVPAGDGNQVIFFVFADNRADANDWNTFNGNYRIGPTNGDEDVTLEEWKTTQKAGGDHGAYKVEVKKGEKCTFTYDANEKKFKVGGYVAPIEFTSFTVAGNDVTIFGTEWDPSNTANDMTLDATDGLYKLVKNNVVINASTLEYKVVANHEWGHEWGNNGQNQTYVFNENGTYDLTFKFNLETKEVSLDAVKVQDGPAIDPYTGNLYIVGQVNDNGWDPSKGIAMLTEDEDTFTLANAQILDSGNGYGYFSFMSELGTDPLSWPANGYRIGAAEDGTEAVLDQFVDMGGFGTIGAFMVEPGYYNITVVLSAGDHGQLKLTAGQAPEPTVDDVYIIGDVNNYAWDPTQGVKMTYNEGIYTAQITTQNQENKEVGYFEFTKKLADVESETPWDDIASFRFGPVCEGDDWVMTEELLGVECDLALTGQSHSIAIPEGTWTVTVDLEHAKFTINGTWPVDTVVPEPYDGDVYIMGEVNDNGGWFTNKGVKMTRDAENNVYTATITTAGENEGYSYFSFTKQLAEGETDWDAIAPYRFGAVTDGNPFLVTEELLGDTLALVYDPDPRAFQIQGGKWDLTLSVDNMKLIIKKVSSLRGDVNMDGFVRIDDVTALIDYLLSGNSDDIDLDAADCNKDTNIRIDDVTSLIDYLLGGSWPAD